MELTVSERLTEYQNTITYKAYINSDLDFHRDARRVRLAYSQFS